MCWIQFDMHVIKMYLSNISISQVASCFHFTKLYIWWLPVCYHILQGHQTFIQTTLTSCPLELGKYYNNIHCTGAVNPIEWETNSTLIKRWL